MPCIIKSMEWVNIRIRWLHCYDISLRINVGHFQRIINWVSCLNKKIDVKYRKTWIFKMMLAREYHLINIRALSLSGYYNFQRYESSSVYQKFSIVLCDHNHLLTKKILNHFYYLVVLLKRLMTS